MTIFCWLTQSPQSDCHWKMFRHWLNGNPSGQQSTCQYKHWAALHHDHHDHYMSIIKHQDKWHHQDMDDIIKMLMIIINILHHMSLSLWRWWSSRSLWLTTSNLWLAISTCDFDLWQWLWWLWWWWWLLLLLLLLLLKWWWSSSSSWSWSWWWWWWWSCGGAAEDDDYDDDDLKRS